MVARFFRLPRFAFAFAIPFSLPSLCACLLLLSFFLLLLLPRIVPNLCALLCRFCRFSMWLNLFGYSACSLPILCPLFPFLYPLCLCCICACLAAIRQKFPVSLVDEFRVFAGWQMVLIWLMNVLIKQNRHLSLVRLLFDLGQKQSCPPPFLPLHAQN